MKASNKAKIEADIEQLKTLRLGCEPGNPWLARIDARIQWLEKKLKGKNVDLLDK